MIGRQPPGSPIRVRPSVPWTATRVMGNGCQVMGDRIIGRTTHRHLSPYHPNTATAGSTHRERSEQSPITLRVLPYPGHHQGVDQMPVASGTLALDPFTREPEAFIEADSTRIVGVYTELDADQTKVVVGDVEQRLHHLVADPSPVKLIMDHDVRDLAGMAQSVGKGNPPRFFFEWSSDH